jgi:hypothetical protein
MSTFVCKTCIVVFSMSSQFVVAGHAAASLVLVEFRGDWLDVSLFSKREVFGTHGDGGL